MTAARGEGPSRRRVLAGGGLLLVAACTGSPGVVRPPPLTSDQRLAQRVTVEIRVLVAAYTATIAAHPGTAKVLGPLDAEHQAHLAALVTLLPAPATSTPTPSPSPGGSTSPSTTPPVVAPSPAAALADLATAERSAAARRSQQAGRAGPELARLLASVAACEAVHAVLVAA